MTDATYRYLSPRQTMPRGWRLAGGWHIGHHSQHAVLIVKMTWWERIKHWLGIEQYHT